MCPPASDVFGPRRGRSRILKFTLAALLSVCPPLSAGILFVRDLPTSGLNLSGASRSNIAPIQGTILGTPFVLGDDFTLAGTGSFLLDSITVWIVGNCPVTTCTPTNATPSSEFSSISLFAGLQSGTLTLLSSGYSATHVQYSGGVDYLTPNGSGLSYPIFQITFSSLGVVIPGGQHYDSAGQRTPTAEMCSPCTRPRRQLAAEYNRARIISFSCTRAVHWCRHLRLAQATSPTSPTAPT